MEEKYNCAIKIISSITYVILIEVIHCRSWLFLENTVASRPRYKGSNPAETDHFFRKSKYLSTSLPKYEI